MTYASLHNHTYFSALDGFSSPKEYLDRAVGVNLTAFAVSEHGNGYSWLYFDKLKKDYPGLKMIYGVEFYEAFDASVQDKNNKYFHLLVLARNERGRIALNRLVTKSNFEGFYYKPRVDLEMLKPYAEDIIVSTACLASKLSREEDFEKSLEYAKEYASIFPHFYLELQSHSHEDQMMYNRKLYEIHLLTGIPFIITTDSHSATKEDLKYQSRLVQVARDKETDAEIYEGCYVQSVEEIHEIMDGHIGHDMVEQGLEETNRLVDLIEDVHMPFQEPKLPHYPLPDGFSTNEEYLESLALEGFERFFANNNAQTDVIDIYRDRFDYEISIINDMGFAGYFIIVWDTIRWSLENDVMVGAGRGSAGGSLVCYFLGITQLDPIKYDLIFERFLNPERISMPDIDIDFGDRDKVVWYLTEKYGENRVCQIINYSYITPIVAIKDTARILEIPYAVSEKISSKFTDKTFEKCMENNKGLLKEYPQYKELFDIASKLAGRLRNVSTHAGGVGIVDTETDDYMPMKLGTKGEHVIQADKKTSEDIGIIKFDILGISTLTLIQEVIQSAGIDMSEIDPNNIDFLQNEKMWDVIKASRTNGVFQVESQGMKELIRRLQPSTLDEVSAVLALYRPDSMDMLEDYIKFKAMPEKIKVWHNDMLDIVDNTYGCIIYQEQLMEIVRRFGGRSMGGADKFRKAIGKKDFDLVKSEAEKLVGEIMENGYGKELAGIIGEYMRTKGGYMFNKSHSMLYAVITLQTAYLKANYPAYFFMALLNQNRSDYGSINKYIVDANDFGIDVLPPNVNKSNMGFSTDGESVLFGIEGIKGIGQTLSEKIVSERDVKVFKNFGDFVERISPSVSQVVALVKSGALPSKDKKNYLSGYASSLYPAKEYKPVKTLPSKKILREKWGMSFPDGVEKEEKLSEYNNMKRKVFENKEVDKVKKKIDTFESKYLFGEEMWEFDTLSVFLTYNPFERAGRFVTPHHNIDASGKCVLVGVISNVTKRKDRRGNQFAFAGLYTHDAEIIDITFWSSQFSKFENYISRGEKVAVLCNKTVDARFVVEKMSDYDTWIDRQEKKYENRISSRKR